MGVAHQLLALLPLLHLGEGCSRNVEGEWGGGAEPAGEQASLQAVHSSG